MTESSPAGDRDTMSVKVPPRSIQKSHVRWSLDAVLSHAASPGVLAALDAEPATGVAANLVLWVSPDVSRPLPSADCRSLTCVPLVCVTVIRPLDPCHGSDIDQVKSTARIGARE